MDKPTPKADIYKANLDRAAPLLAKIKDEGIGHFIDGKVVPAISGATFETKSPIDGAVLAKVARGHAEDIDRAATAASLAFKSWRDMAPAMRRKLLHRLADAIEANAEDIAVLECVDTGQAYRFMAKAALRAAENFRFFADKCTEARDGQSTPSDEHWNISTRVPIGPVGVITPWNTPFMLSTWKIAPALAAGCTVVHKPAEWSPITAQWLAKLAKEAGIPDGVLNTVHGFGEEAGKALTEHPAIKAIGFVGESSTGSAIMAQGAPTLKRVHFELGGKNPVIVFDDADLDRALDAVAHRRNLAADGLADGHDGIADGALRFGETDGDLRHRLRDHAQLLAAPGEACEEIEQQHRREEHRGETGEHQHAAALADQRLQRGKETDGQQNAAGNPDSCKRSCHRVDAARRASLLDRLQQLADGLAVVIGGTADGERRRFDLVQAAAIDARTVVERIEARRAGRHDRRSPVSVDRALRRVLGRGRVADVQSLLNGGQRNFSRVFDLFGGVRHVESEPSSYFRSGEPRTSYPLEALEPDVILSRHQGWQIPPGGPLHPGLILLVAPVERNGRG